MLDHCQPHPRSGRTQGQPTASILRHCGGSIRQAPLASMSRHAPFIPNNPQQPEWDGDEPTGGEHRRTAHSTNGRGVSIGARSVAHSTPNSDQMS